MKKKVIIFDKKGRRQPAKQRKKSPRFFPTPQEDRTIRDFSTPEREPCTGTGTTIYYKIIRGKGMGLREASEIFKGGLPPTQVAERPASSGGVFLFTTEKYDRSEVEKCLLRVNLNCSTIRASQVGCILLNGGEFAFFWSNNEIYKI